MSTITKRRGKVVSRLDKFKPGDTFENALRFYEFDQRLRLLLQDALEVIEVAFCAGVGYVLGRRRPDPHLGGNRIRGSIVRLFGMMKNEHQIEVATCFGLANDQGGVMHSWMLSLNDLRYTCAHNNRGWNRITRSAKKPSPRMVTPEFRHFAKPTRVRAVQIIWRHLSDRLLGAGNQY